MTPGRSMECVGICDMIILIWRYIPIDEYLNVILGSTTIEILKQLYRLSDAVLQDSLTDTVWVFTSEAFTW